MSDRDVINTAIAEAGAHPEGLTAVLYTILNRSQRDGKTPSQVVKQRNQYEGYSSPGPASVKAQSDPKVRALAEKVWAQVQSRAVPDPTGGGYDFRAQKAAKGLSAPNGTVTIGGNTFARGGGAGTALAAIDAVAPNPQSRPTALGYAQTPASIRAMTVNPDGTPDLAAALAAKYGASTPTPRGASGASVTGFNLPPAMPTPRPAPPVPQALTSHKVNTVPINPATGNPYNGLELAQQAANTEAARLRGSMPAGPVASIPQVRVPQTSAPSLQDALNTYAAREALNRNGVTKTTAQAGNVALPPGVVPRSAKADMEAADTILRAKSVQPPPVGAAYGGGWGSSAFAPKPAVPAASGTLVANKDQTRLPVLPASAYMPIAPKTPAIAAIDAATVPLPRPRPVPSVPVPTVPVPSYLGKQPLTKFLPAAQRQNDTLTTLGNHAGNILSATPAGHIYSLLTGAPNTGGGILNGLFGYGGLFGGVHAPSFAPPAPSGPAPGAGFLAAQGVSTNGMTDGQVQNNLMSAINSSGGNFGPGYRY